MIGGSDAPDVLEVEGVGYRGRLAVYADKRGQSEPVEETEAMRIAAERPVLHALKTATVCADAMLELDVYRRAVLKSIHMLKLATHGGATDPRDGSREQICICDEILDVLETAHLVKLVTAYGDQPEFRRPQQQSDDDDTDAPCLVCGAAGGHDEGCPVTQD